MADRAACKRQLIAAVEAALVAARAAHAAAAEGATHSESRAENDKDTRGLEQSYLARGYAARVAELEAALVGVAALPVGPPGAVASAGAIVTVVDDDDARHRYYLAPWGGGLALADAITVVTPASPIGRALFGRRRDDEVELQRPDGPRSWTIEAIG